MQISANTTGINSKTAAASADTEKSTLVHEFQSFVADIEDLIKATTQLTGEDLNKAKAKLQQRIASAKGSAEEIGENIVNRARKTAESTNVYVHEKPWTAIGASIGPGPWR